jgi:hypothetical protein
MPGMTFYVLYLYSVEILIVALSGITPFCYQNIYHYEKSTNFNHSAFLYKFYAC